MRRITVAVAIRSSCSSVGSVACSSVFFRGTVDPRVTEEFTPDERARLAPYFTNLDSHIFALTNLPETVKGALFARYSRSAKIVCAVFFSTSSPRKLRPATSMRRSLLAARPRLIAQNDLRSCVQRLWRRLGRATRWRAHRVRVRVQRSYEGARVGTVDGISRAVHAIRALHRQAPRSLALSRPGRNRPRSAAGSLRRDDGRHV